MSASSRGTRRLPEHTASKIETTYIRNPSRERPEACRSLYTSQQRCSTTESAKHAAKYTHQKQPRDCRGPKGSDAYISARHPKRAAQRRDAATATTVENPNSRRRERRTKQRATYNSKEDTTTWKPERTYDNALRRSRHGQKKNSPQKLIPDSQAKPFPNTDNSNGTYPQPLTMEFPWAVNLRNLVVQEPQRSEAPGDNGDQQPKDAARHLSGSEAV